jgi:predicted ATPase/class 3 adenylate cyclase
MPVLAQPTGTLTFLFTDVEGSTRLWDESPAPMQTALAQHDALLRGAIEASGGFVFKTVGDAFHAAFPTAAAALTAALSAQEKLLGADWGNIGSLRVRMALDTGVAEARDGDYFGPVLNRLARIRDAAHGQQVLISRATAELLREQLGDDTELLDLGEHPLRGIKARERIYQVVHPRLPRQFPPLRSQESHTVRLPVYLNDFVGRDAILQQLEALVLDEGARLVTLVGPAGTGKTRLAVEAASRLAERFGDGVFFVPMAGVRDAANVPGVIADTLGVPRAGAAPVAQAVVNFLRDRRPLLVMDNFEQVLDAAPQVSEILRATPASVMVTSRAPLGVYGERAFQVPPLTLPEGSARREDLAKNEAVSLFLARARAASAGFELTPGNADALAQICRRLDGLPLAIELAAARIRLLDPEALLQRLDQRLALLTGGARDMDERQRTLRAAIDWSYNLLNDDERVLFRRMAVLRGGTLEAVEAICGDALSTTAIDLAGSLLDKSLLRHIDSGTSAGRLGMLETIREYAGERLRESDEGGDVEARHADYFAGLAEALGSQVRGSGQVPAIRALEEEQENLRAAFGWFEARSEGQGMMRMASSLWPFWEIHGDFSEGRRCLRAAVTAAEAMPGSEAARGQLLLGCGRLAIGQGEDEEAAELLQDSLESAGRSGDAGLGGRALTSLAIAQWRTGDVQEATRLCERSRAALLDAGDGWGVAEAEHWLGHYVFDRGDYASAREYWDSSYAGFREAGDLWGYAQPLKDLGLLSFRSGDYEAARQLYEESLGILMQTREVRHIADIRGRLGELALFEGRFDEALAAFDEQLGLFRQLGDPTGVAESLNRSAEVSARQDDIERARSLYEESLAIAKGIKNRRLIAGMLHNLGNVALKAGQLERAAQLYGESLAIHRDLGREGGQADALEGLAEARAAAGETRNAVRLIGLASALREKAGIHADPFDRIEHASGRRERLDALRDALGDDAFESAFAEGACLDVDEVVSGQNE